jgi:glycosyltransferase involved in cell wall biosynthesis
MTISLIVCAYNEEKYLPICLEHALKRVPENLLEVLIVNNASTDKTASVAAGFPKVRVVNEPLKGLTKARQRGFLEAKGDLLAYIDADTRMPEKWFEILNREFAANPELLFLSGPYVYYDTPAWQRWCVKYLYYGMLARFIRFFTGYTASGGNFAVKKTALEKVGGFDTTIAFHGEDTDIVRRVHKIGSTKFSNAFYMQTSGRRFAKEGTLKTGWTYVANYTAIMFSKKPLTKTYKDIR